MEQISDAFYHQSMTLSTKAIAIAVLAVTLSSVGLSSTSADQHHHAAPSHHVSSFDSEVLISVTNGDALISTVAQCAIACVFCILAFAATRRLSAKTNTEKVTRSKIRFADPLYISRFLKINFASDRGLVLRM